MIKIPVVMIFPNKFVSKVGLPVQKNISEEVVNGIYNGLGLIFKLDRVQSSAVLAEKNLSRLAFGTKSVRV